MKKTADFHGQESSRSKFTHYSSSSRSHHASRVEEVRVQPQPLMDKCNPLCPLFRCGRDALFTINKPVKGRIIRVAQCRLTGSDCINGECQYASCRINSLLPDGKCVKALEKKTSRFTDEELIRQIQAMEDFE